MLYITVKRFDGLVQVRRSTIRSVPTFLCRGASQATSTDKAAASRKTTNCSVNYMTSCNNDALYALSMDEPSVQLQLDLNRAVQHELATRRPLLHRLHGSSWVLQIPRPANAVRHGSRFYYNILVDPCFVRQPCPSNGWFSQPSPTLNHLQTTATLEELLKDLEILASSLRPESTRKSNVLAEEELEKLETLVDAVAVTSVDNCYEDSFRQIHPDVPCFASPEASQQISTLQHFRTLGTINEFGEDGCRDWRSTTAVAGLPEWLGLSTLSTQEDDSDQPHTLLVAFNNYHHNSSTRLAKLQTSTGSRQKRHAAIVPNEDEDIAEAVLFTTRGLSSDVAALISRADPAINTLAVVCSSSTPSGDVRHEIGTNPWKQLHMSAAYHVAERNIAVEKGKGFLAWLIAKAQFTTRGNEAVHPRAADNVTCRAEGEPRSPREIALSNGESKVLI